MIEIDIVIKMDENCEKRMPMRQARELFSNLSDLFGGQQAQMDFPRMNMNEQYNAVSTESTNERIERLKAESSAKSGGCGCGKKKEPQQPQTRRGNTEIKSKKTSTSTTVKKG